MWLGVASSINHVQSEGVAPNAIGSANLVLLARASMEVMDLDELLVTGELRTGTGVIRSPRFRLHS